MILVLLHLALLTRALSAAQCMDLLFADGTTWFDDASLRYSCAAFYITASKCTTKYSYQNMTSMDACCVCGGGSTGPYALAGNKAAAVKITSKGCVPNPSWKHPIYGDTCTAYGPDGPSYAFRCDPLAAAACCSCVLSSTTGIYTNCSDKTVSGKKWHDSDGYACRWYKRNIACASDGDQHAFGGLTANSACCYCGGGQTCVDLLEKGLPWHDKGGAAYNCDYYSKGTNCAQYGALYPSEGGRYAKDACCACGGGEGAQQKAYSAGGLPSPNTGDNLNGGMEWAGEISFSNKKHLQGDFILYWNVDSFAQTATFGLLTPPATSGQWFALGFSPDGGMALSDSVIAWFDGINPVTGDYYLQNQSPSGVKSVGRQNITNLQFLTVSDTGRAVLTFTRDWVTVGGAVPLTPGTDFSNLIYASGAISKQCIPFCNHPPKGRYTASVALAAPPGISLYELNVGQFDEPCNGPAELECAQGLSCYHADALDLDFFAVNYNEYGKCLDPKSMGDKGSAESVAPGVQTIFQTNNGGFLNKTILKNGFVLLFTVNKVSAPGSFGPDDTITMALISTNPSAQGWIGCGWSPSGLMKGTDVVIGYSDGDQVNFIGDFFLQAQVSSKNQVANKQGLVNARSLSKGGQLALMFQRPLTPADSVGILEGAVSFIYANGPQPDLASCGSFIPYHLFRIADSVTVIPLLSEAGKAGDGESCAGPDKIECKAGLNCTILTQALLSMITMFANRTGFQPPTPVPNSTSFLPPQAENTGTGSGNINWRRRSNGTNPFTNMSALQALIGTGRCGPTREAFNPASINLTQLTATALSPSDWANTVSLNWDFKLYWNNIYTKPSDTVPSLISFALVASGRRNGWLGLGFGKNGMMIGSNAVIGLASGTNSTVLEYNLMNKLPWEILPLNGTNGESMGVQDLSATAVGRDIAIFFKRKIDKAAPITQGPNSIIYAIGNLPNPGDDYFGYHYTRDNALVTFY